jgi:hypothetical protein
MRLKQPYPYCDQHLSEPDRLRPFIPVPDGYCTGSAQALLPFRGQGGWAGKVFHFFSILRHTERTGRPSVAQASSFE